MPHLLKFGISKGIIYMFMSGLAFAGMNICVKFVSKIPVTEVVFFRSVVQIIIAFTTLMFLKKSAIGNNIFVLFLRGLFGSLGLVCYFYTVQNMQLGSAVVLHFIAPIVTTIFAIFLASEKVKPIQWLFFAMAFLGVIIVNGVKTIASPQTIVIGLSGVVFSALAYNTIKKLKDKEDPNVIVLYFPLVSVVLMLGYWFIFKPLWIMPNFYQLIMLMITGIFTQLGQIWMTKAYMLDKASRVSAVTYLGIIWGVIAGVFIFNEHYYLIHFTGMGIIVIAVMLNLKFSNKTNVSK